MKLFKLGITFVILTCVPATITILAALLLKALSFVSGFALDANFFWAAVTAVFALGVAPAGLGAAEYYFRGEL